MYAKHLNAIGDSLALSDVLPPDTECQPVGQEFPFPKLPPGGAPQCPPCDCVDKKKLWSLFWIVIGAAALASFLMGGEEKSLTGGTL